jgi:MFS superfamily sulfate permease-like transporter
LVILIAWPFVPFSWAKKIPSQLVVLLVAVPFGAALDLSHPHAVRVGLTGQYELGPKFLVAVPDHLLDVVSFPDFSHVFSSSSLSFVMMFALVGSVESLLSTKAIDATDPLGRKSNLDRDLFAVGLGNVLAGLLGGLPMIAEIVRSSANVASGARTRLANVFHGAYLLLFMALVPGWIHRIPLSALAAMLLFTGLKLASPKEFAHTYRLGHDQLAVFLTTIVATLATDLLVGIGLGICLKLVLHMVRGVPLRELWKPRMRQETIDGVHRLFLEGAVVFTNFLGLKDSLSKIALDTPVVVDLTRAHLVDHTVLSQLDALGAERRRSGGKLEVVGLDSHRASSMHPLATRYAQKVGREMGMGGER